MATALHTVLQPHPTALHTAIQLHPTALHTFLQLHPSAQPIKYFLKLLHPTAQHLPPTRNKLHPTVRHGHPTRQQSPGQTPPPCSPLPHLLFTSPPAHLHPNSAPPVRPTARTESSSAHYSNVINFFSPQICTFILDRTINDSAVSCTSMLNLGKP